ncbi:MAG: carboxylesterase [Sporolactobacillus sp.]|nr:carboxylesterase [Sporolactobacillus sp.]
MGRVRPPKPFFFEGGRRAVLLLHGFTGNSADVRQLGKYLYRHGYTCYGPHYSGHAVPPEQLVRTGPADWWVDVTRAVRFLKQAGYPEIAVGGLSLGGVFSLKCGYTFSVKGIVSMCAPAYRENGDRLYRGVLRYMETYKHYEGKKPEEIATEIARIRNKIPPLLAAMAGLIHMVRQNLGRIYVPAFIAQASRDEMIDPSGANIIYHDIHSTQKQLKWYEKSGHVITLGTEKAMLHQDVYAFLESLDWSVS